MRDSPIILAILVGGLIAGACDITYAIVFSGFNGAPAARILQSVASGLLGSAAYEGGAGAAALGLILHFLLALLIAAIFVMASRRFALLVRHPYIAGALYGVGVYWVMNLIVLPLSAFPGEVTFVPIVVVTSLFVHAFLVGVPIALAARKGVHAERRAGNAREPSPDRSLTA